MARPEGREKPFRRGGEERYPRNGKSLDKAKFRRAKAVESKLTLDPRSDWYATELSPLKVSAPDTTAVPPTLIEQVQKHAQALLQDEAASYAESHLKTSSSYKFMSTIMSSGTWTDKVSALTLVVQESPLHTVKPLENLIGLASKRSRDQALMALGALKDLLAQGNVLPDRKLRMFSKQPGLLSTLQGVKQSWTPSEDLPNGLRSEHLLLWAYEDRLKSLYFEMLKTLEKWGNDEVEFARLRAVTFIWELLRDKPEQEENLLRLLINKLGDKSKKVASRASHLLLQLQTSHPSMKTIIVSSIESDILLRSGQSSHAKYYAVITLNQTVLQTSDPEVANKLLDVYFSLFIAILNQSQRAREITPKAQAPEEVQEEPESAEARSRKRKRSKPQLASSMNKPEGELNDKITAQILTGINRAFPFSKKDSLSFEKHLDTMFRITHSANFNTSIQALMLIQQISSTHQISTDRFMRTLYDSLLDHRLITSSKQTMYLNLLYRSLKSDISVRRVKAFVKRLVQVLSLHEPPFIVAALYLIIELRTFFPGLQSMFSQPETHDVESDDEGDIASGAATDAPRMDPTSAVAKRNTTTYDGRARNPEYSNADLTCLWELTPWCTHYHPSITLFGNYLLSPSTATSTSAQSAAPTKPDPATHTLSHFLDRFAYRNPKTKESAAAGLRGQSIMQPALASSGAADSLLATGKRLAGADGANYSVNDEAFWRRKAEDVREDEAFFHRYFGVVNATRKGDGKQGKEKDKRRRSGRDEDEEEVDQEGVHEDGGWDEDEVWKAIVGSKGAQGVDPDADEFADDDELALDSDGGMEGYGDSDDEEEEEDEGDDGDQEEEDGGVEIDLASDSGSDQAGANPPDVLVDADAEANEDDASDAPLALDDASDDAESALFSSEDEDGAAKASRGNNNVRKEMTAEEVRAFIAERAAEGASAAGSGSKRQDEGGAKGKKGLGKKGGRSVGGARPAAEVEGEVEGEDEEGGRRAKAGKKKRRKLNNLPMFGSADEWAALLADGAEEDETWKAD